MPHLEITSDEKMNAPNPTQNRADVQPERVAVIAVHGVGDPGAGSTAQNIVTLLARLFRTTSPKESQTVYTPFISSGLTISNRPAPRPKPAHEARFVSYSATARRWGATDHYEVDSDPIKFIGSQLSEFQLTAEDRTYTTVKHEGYRRDPVTGGEQVRVDVYELCWADLVRISSGVLGFFTELYQLVFHVTHLASKTVSAMGKKLAQEPDDTYGSSLLWGRYAFFADLAARYLSVMVLFFNVWLLPMVLMTALLFAAKLGPVSIAFGVLILMIGLGGVGYWLSPSPGKGKFQVILALATCAAISLPFVARGKLSRFCPWLAQPLHGFMAGHPNVFPMTAATCFLILASILIAAFIKRFNEGNPNSTLPAATIGLAFWIIWLVFLGFFGNAMFAALTSLVLLTVMADVNYAMLLFLEIIVVCLGAKTCYDARKLKTRQEIERVFITAILGLGLPTVLFSIATISTWTVLTKAVLPSMLKDLHLDGITDELLTIASIGFGWTGLLAGVGCVIAVAVLLPSILAEGLFFEPAQPTSKRLAGWLTSGASSVVVIIGTLFIAGVIPLGFSIDYLVQGNPSVSLPATILLGALAAFGVTVLILKDHAGPWTLAFGPILNKALDVDAYLRQNPKNRTPKARIFCRYASLLRYVFSHPLNYTKVVILSHSQGTVISADLLKYLKDPKTELDTVLLDEDAGHRKFKKGISFFTMGCPLRQLYSERFPAWYDWARSDNVLKRPIPPNPSVLDPTIKPHGDELGIVTWSNAYGAGDYIGRSLWRGVDDLDFADLPSGAPSWDVTIPVDASAKPGNVAREFCIGPFAHTRYWDECGDAVARELNNLI